MTQVIVPASTTAPGFAINEGHNGHDGYNGHGFTDRDATYRGNWDLSRQLGDNLNSVAVAIVKAAGDNQLATNVAAGALGVAIQTTTAATNLAIQVSNAQVLTSIEKTHAAAMLLAVQQAAAQLAASERCCCELKEVMRAIEAARIQAALVDAKLEIALHNRRGVHV